MKDRILFAVIMFFVLGSSISATDSISQSAKSIFHGIGMFILGMIGIISLYNFFTKGKKKESV